MQADGGEATPADTGGKAAASDEARYKSPLPGMGARGSDAGSDPDAPGAVRVPDPDEIELQSVPDPDEIKGIPGAQPPVRR